MGLIRDLGDGIVWPTRSLRGWRLGDAEQGFQFGIGLVTSEILSASSGFVISGRVGQCWG